MRYANINWRVGVGYVDGFSFHGTEYWSTYDIEKVAQANLIATIIDGEEVCKAM